MQQPLYSLKMKASTLIRLFSLIGILTLLILQYAWFKNSYTLLEQEIVDNTKQSLTKSIDEDLFIRVNNVFGGTIISNHANDLKGEVLGVSDVSQKMDINFLLQKTTIEYGQPCNALVLDSIFNANMIEAIGFAPHHTLKLIDAAAKDTSKVSKFTFYSKITEKKLAEVILINPLGSILKQAQLIVAVSILLVIIIGFVLMYLLRSTLRETKFVSFIRDYTHALTHELKTPISGIYMASSQLASGILEDKPESRQKYYAICKESSSKLLSTIDRILLVAKAEHARITPNLINVEVKPYIEKIVETHRSNNFRSKEVTLTTACNPEDLNWRFDAFLIENVLNNLIDNAIKYSDQVIDIHVSAERSTKGLLLRIKDSGFGISENELKHIFHNFERGNKVEGKGIDGYGIGLNYVSKVIRAHKGNIRVESKEGIGTEFFITLPE